MERFEIVAQKRRLRHREIFRLQEAYVSSATQTHAAHKFCAFSNRTVRQQSVIQGRRGAEE